MIEHHHLTRAVLALSLTFTFAPSARADRLAAQTDLERRSITDGVGRDHLELLETLPALGTDVVRAQLVQILGLQADKINIAGTTGTSVRLRASHWHMSISGNGAAVKFRREIDPEIERVGGDKRIEPDELTSLGLKFIQQALAGIVPLDAGEELVALKTRYERQGGQDAKSSTPDVPVVVSNAIVFGRKIDGIPIVGPGSKIALIFGNDRTVKGFDVDWPRFRHSGRNQAVLPPTSIRERASALASMHFQPDSVTVQRTECGYIDLGVRHRSDAPIQAGCAFFYIANKPGSGSATDSGSTDARFDIIPAGTVAEPDPNWPLTALCTADVCKGSEVGSALFTPQTRPRR